MKLQARPDKTAAQCDGEKDGNFFHRQCSIIGTSAKGVLKLDVEGPSRWMFPGGDPPSSTVARLFNGGSILSRLFVRSNSYRLSCNSFASTPPMRRYSS